MRDSHSAAGVQFRTTPLDNTGVPHILEHTVLCGSEKYPCRDPFFKMLNRSLSTFMNAFTASDFTLYPFSTQNPKDFHNLLSVYLDAVFFPCLRELDFWQEGWRLEHDNPKDPNSPLVFKGVVFNEMKGAFTDNERVFAQHLQNRLLPGHTYSVVSGGDPVNIPDLTWEQLKQFHATHYHPSNARDIASDVRIRIALKLVKQLLQLFTICTPLGTYQCLPQTSPILILIFFPLALLNLTFFLLLMFFFLYLEISPSTRLILSES
ncbi:presequence protease, mitochondrial-like [Ambystoma mexicanum]|uniref:presequence protease, mitochondrial-like n=1 Tax=Ambystoma mexicanum TaxID=8296 RepID=UPI0037E834E4